VERELKGKVAIITGATGALGRVVTRKLAQNEAKIVVLYRTEEAFDELSRFLGDQGSSMLGFEGDATVSQSVQGLVKKAIDEYGHVDVLLNIVGGYSGGKTLADTDEELWDRMMTLNLKSAFLCSKAVLPHMMERKYGKIVNVSARTAVQRGSRARSGAYAVSKAGIVTLPEALAEETRDYGIQVNCIMPSVIDTEANRRMLPKADFSKWVDPEEIAEVVLFLASDASKPMSGASIPVYGRG
jgi:NAD(P)-dependent dehydrogenase (short-subunit alcohol dehydrogenase family)